jgi:hypothetical protein
VAASACNPYRAMEISDRFGLHCEETNPTIEKLKEIRITKAYWFFSSERPTSVPENAVPQNKDGHVLVHVDASFNDLRSAYPNLDKAFLLRAEGVPPVHLRAERGYWNSECYLRVPEEEFARMKPDIPYRLEPVATKNDFSWTVDKNVVLVKSIHPSEAIDIDDRSNMNASLPVGR